jgi:hypothetical protein
MSTNTHLSRIIASSAVVAAIASASFAPAANAASAGQTVKVTAKSAYVDNHAPGRFFIDTIFKGESFKIARVVRVTHGGAKGLWYYGTASVTGNHAKDSKGVITPFKVTGWVKAWAFS